MAVTIRQATPVDAPVIVDFNLRMAHETEDKGLDREVLAAGVRAALADPVKAVYYVAEENGIILGQVSCTREWSDWRNGWLWWLQSVYVLPQARRRGIFRALYEHIYQAAQRDPEVIGLRLYVERANQVAQQTYLGLGMEWAPYLILQRYPL